MNFNFSPNQYKKIGEHIEKKVLKTSDQSAILLGAALLLISLCAFLFSALTRELGCATGYELILRSHNMLATIFATFHLLAIVFLLIPNFPDKFQFATTFTIINIPLFL